MPSIDKEFREALEAQGKKYCHRCDEIYYPPDAEHDEHERQRAEKRKAVGLDPNGEKASTEIRESRICSEKFRRFTDEQTHVQHPSPWHGMERDDRTTTRRADRGSTPT